MNVKPTNKYKHSREQHTNSLLWKSCPNDTCEQSLHLQVGWESQSQQPPAQKPLVSSVMLDFPMVKHTATAMGQWFILPTKNIISNQQSCFKPKRCTFISSNLATVQNYKPNTMVEFIQREYGGCSLPYWPDTSAQKNFIHLFHTLLKVI